jgi:hypothetical protein
VSGWGDRTLPLITLIELISTDQRRLTADQRGWARIRKGRKALEAETHAKFGSRQEEHSETVDKGFLRVSVPPW